MGISRREIEEPVRINMHIYILKATTYIHLFILVELQRHDGSGNLYIQMNTMTTSPPLHLCTQKVENASPVFENNMSLVAD